MRPASILIAEFIRLIMAFAVVVVVGIFLFRISTYLADLNVYMESVRIYAPHQLNSAEEMRK